MSRSPPPGARSLSCLQPALRCRNRQLAQAVIGDLLDRLAYKGLDQQRLGFLLGQTTRTKIEQQAVVERAGGRAMSAGHVVGENLEFRLVVSLGLVRQEQ